MRFAKERQMTPTTSLPHHRSTPKARGFSLIEVLVALAITTLASVAVGFAAYNYYVDSKKKTAFNEARTVRQAVKARKLEKDSCPTFAMLVEDDALDEDSPKQDPWGNAWRIRCEGTRVIVETDGPDRQRGTEDDVRVPPAEDSVISATTEG
jgi:general secretion pathway protein G